MYDVIDRQIGNSQKTVKKSVEKTGPHGKRTPTPHQIPKLLLLSASKSKK